MSYVFVKYFTLFESVPVKILPSESYVYVNDLPVGAVTLPAFLLIVTSIEYVDEL